MSKYLPISYVTIFVHEVRNMENSKSNIYYIYKTLETFSDEEHFLTQKQIIEGANQLFGVTFDRKTVSSTIQALRDLGFDISDNTSGRGVALLERNFNKSEVKFLIDAVFSSKSIPGDRAQDLAEKVSSCLSKYDRKTYAYLNKSSDVSRTGNSDVFLNIEIINEAIQRGKCISFKYIDYDENGKVICRREGQIYNTSPCYLINNFGRYYYLGYREKYHSVSTYRLDYMIDVKIIEDQARLDPNELAEFKNYSSIADYLSQHIYLFGGKSVDAVLVLKEPRAILHIRDWFGKNAKIYKEDGNLKAHVKCNETALFYWVMQYSEHIKIESPQELIDKVVGAANNIIEKYK